MADKPKHAGGRPLNWKTVEELQPLIDKYFDDCIKDKEPFTITGLALALKTGRETLLDYEHKRGDKFSDAIKEAKLRCQNYAEKYLYSGKQVAGAIFNLSANYKWENKIIQDVNVKGSIRSVSDKDLDKQLKEAEAALKND